MNTPITNASHPDPTFHTRLPARCHPLSGVIVPKVRQNLVQNWPWSSEESKNRYLTGNTGDGVMYAFPGVRNDRVEVITTFLMLHFLIDDHIVESESMGTGKKREALRRFFGIMRRLIQPDADNPVELMVDHVTSGFLSCTDEVARRHAPQLLETIIQAIAAGGNHDGKVTAMRDLDGYLKYRMAEAGVLLSFALAFWGGDIYIPSHIHNDPKVESFFKSVSDHLVLVNDIYSYNVERKRFEEGEAAVFNAVSLIMIEKGIDAQEAMDIIKQRLTALEDLALEGAAALRERYAGTEKVDEKEVVNKMIIVLLEMMAGNCEWSKFCGRYNPSTASQEVRSGTEGCVD